jgi:YggT family protein
VIIEIITIALFVFILLLFARVAVNLVLLFSRNWRPKGVALVIIEGVLSATDPPVKAVRSLLPEINLGGVRLDLSVLVLMILATVAINILSATR